MNRIILVVAALFIGLIIYAGVNSSGCNLFAACPVATTQVFEDNFGFSSGEPFSVTTLTAPTANRVFDFNDNSDATLVGVFSKGTDETITTDSTLSQDSTFSFKLDPDDWYLFEGFLVIQSPTAADFKIDWGGQTLIHFFELGDLAFTVTSQNATETFQTSGDKQMLSFQGAVLVNNTAPYAFTSIDWAQGTSDAGNTTMFAESYIKLWHIVDN